MTSPEGRSTSEVTMLEFAGPGERGEAEVVLKKASDDICERLWVHEHGNTS
jgi:hypothetical protein